MCSPHYQNPYLYWSGSRPVSSALPTGRWLCIECPEITSSSLPPPLPRGHAHSKATYGRYVRGTTSCLGRFDFKTNFNLLNHIVTNREKDRPSPTKAGQARTPGGALKCTVVQTTMRRDVFNQTGYMVNMLFLHSTSLLKNHDDPLLSVYCCTCMRCCGCTLLCAAVAAVCAGAAPSAAAEPWAYSMDFDNNTKNI